VTSSGPSKCDVQVCILGDTQQLYFFRASTLLFGVTNKSSMSLKHSAPTESGLQRQGILEHKVGFSWDTGWGSVENLQGHNVPKPTCRDS